MGGKRGMQKDNGVARRQASHIWAAVEILGREACMRKAVLDRGLKGGYAGFGWIAGAARREKASAKLQVRPILLKKISFMIFFNDCLSDYETIRCH